MLLPNLARSPARAAAIGCFQILAKVPAVFRRLASHRLHRLITIAALADLRYSGIFTQSSYAPWNGDAEFQSVFSIVRSHTLVDEYRCYELWTLCKQLEALDPGDILEIGVWRGGARCLLWGGNKNSRSKGFFFEPFSGAVYRG